MQDNDTAIAKRVANLDLTAIMARVAEETGLSPQNLARAEDLYRKFLTLKVKYPQKTFVPPRLVDIVWHTHIIYTRKYMADCDMLIGGYIHHTPTTEDTEELFEKSTVAAFESDFGINLRKVLSGPWIKAGPCG